MNSKRASPSGHILHFEDPGTLVYLPSSQIIGNAEPDGQYAPIGHMPLGGLETTDSLVQK